MFSHRRPSLKGKAPVLQPDSIPITLPPSLSDTSSSSDLDFPTYTRNPNTIPLPTTPTPSKNPQATLEDLARQLSAAASFLETRTLHDTPLTTSALASFLRKMQVGLVSAAKGMERAEAQRVEDLRAALDEQDARRLEHELDMRGQREEMRRMAVGYRNLYGERIHEIHGRLRQEVDDCQREHLQKLQECERRFDELRAAREEAEEKAAISTVTANEIVERMKKKHYEETKVLEVKVEGLEKQLEKQLKEREKKMKDKEKEKEKQEKVNEVNVNEVKKKADEKAKEKEQQQHVAAPVAGKKRKATPIDEGDGGTTERKTKRSKRHRP
ncbi:hypothetical protein BS50DRAFT_619273 [Corynespora cassiicola Philippines]|uniref:Uncharacterized protein n=1 Tax=Corynespora cassiicola Philippines TaxID=1448308 RepID=A0A2T2NYE0_CORCC|nr:hypothetical protein BS50DRAFT_619273 [Corynespora cassiicola Philippines]